VVRPAISRATARMRRAAVAVVVVVVVVDVDTPAAGVVVVVTEALVAVARRATPAVVLDTSPGTVCKAANATTAAGR